MPDVEDASDDEKKEKAKASLKKKGKKKGKGGVVIPDEWPWEDAKKIFEKPDVLPADQIEVNKFLSFSISINIVLQLEWTNPDVEGLVQFLVTEKGFK